MLRTKQISVYNKETLKLTLSLVKDAGEQLKHLSFSLCSLTPSNPSRLNQSVYDNLILRDTPLRSETGMSNLKICLNNFITAHLPGRQHLSVAVGVAKFVKSQKPYKSFAQPLIEAIVNLFHHIEAQSNTEMILIHFISFQSAFVNTCNRIIEINKLFSYGPKFSKITFSQLLTTKELSLFGQEIMTNLPSEVSSLRKARLIQRLINNAKFIILEGTNKNCPVQSLSCSCTSRNITLSVPTVPEIQGCLFLSNQNKNKFSDGKGFYYLSDIKQATTISKGNLLNLKNGGSSLIRILNPPLIKIKSSILSILTSERSIYFPENINDNISISCHGTKQNTKINLPGLIRIYEDCNITSTKDSIFVKSTKSFSSHILKTKRNLFKNFTFSSHQTKFPKDVLDRIEQKFKDALLSEDQLQIEVNSLAAQSWLMRWMEGIAGFLLPTISLAGAIVVIPLAIFLLCTCLPLCKIKMCKRNNSCAKNDNLVSRVEKLETFFAYCVAPNYHNMETSDIHYLEQSNCDKKE